MTMHLPNQDITRHDLIDRTSPSDRVLVVDARDRLRYREVHVLRRSRDEVYVNGGLERGERVCVSSLEGVVDGMAVRTSDIPQTADGSAAPEVRSPEARS